MLLGAEAAGRAAGPVLRRRVRPGRRAALRFPRARGELEYRERERERGIDRYMYIYMYICIYIYIYTYAYVGLRRAGGCGPPPAASWGTCGPAPWTRPAAARSSALLKLLLLWILSLYSSICTVTNTIISITIINTIAIIAYYCYYYYYYYYYYNFFLLLAFIFLRGPVRTRDRLGRRFSIAAILVIIFIITIVTIRASRSSRSVSWVSCRIICTAIFHTKNCQTKNLWVNIPKLLR